MKTSDIVRVTLGIEAKRCETCRYFDEDEATLVPTGPYKGTSTFCREPKWLAGRTGRTDQDECGPHSKEYRDWKPKILKGKKK